MFISVVTALKSVSVEPAMVLYYTSLAMTTLSGQNLVLQKACHPGDTIPSPSATCSTEKQSQEWVTNIETWKHLIVLFGPLFFVLFAGPWSDSHNRQRKPLMYLPLFGQILSDLLSLLNVYYWNWSPVVAALTQSVPPALTGWRSCFIIGVNSYIADITSEKSRTVRLGVNAALYFLGTPIGAFLFGLVFRRIGFLGVFLLCVVFNVVAVLHLFIFVPEIKPEGEQSKLKTFEGFVDYKHIVECFKTVFKNRNGYKRGVLILLVLAMPLTLAPLQGEYSVYYYFLRIKFDWDETKYGFYAGYKCIVTFFGTLITLGIFSRLLNISDALIGVMASVTLMAASIGFTFATTAWELFVFCLVDFMHGAGLAVVSSMASKVVEESELGKVNSVMGVADAIYPLANLPLYTQVYNHTLSVMPGAFFLISFLYGGVALTLFSGVYCLQKLQSRNEDTKKNITS